MTFREISRLNRTTPSKKIARVLFSQIMLKDMYVMLNIRDWSMIYLQCTSVKDRVISLFYHLCYLCRVFVMLSCLFVAALWSPAWKGLTSWLLFVMFNCTFVTFLCSILGQVWHLIVLIPDLCPLFLLYFCETLHPQHLAYIKPSRQFLNLGNIKQMSTYMVHAS